MIWRWRCSNIRAEVPRPNIEEADSRSLQEPSIEQMRSVDKDLTANQLPVFDSDNMKPFSLVFVCILFSSASCLTATAPVGYFRYIELPDSDLSVQTNAAVIAEYCITLSDALNTTNVGVTINPVESPNQTPLFRRGFWNPLIDKAERNQPDAVGFRNFAIVSDGCLKLHGEVAK